MKLNYRDKAILLIFLSVLVVVAGIFGLIKPKFEEIDKHEKELSAVKAEWAQIETKINEIKPLQDAINESYNESSELADDFVDSSLISSTYKLDQFMQPHVDACNNEEEELKFRAKSVEVGSMSTTTLSYYYFKPSVLTSSMFDAADINGNYQAAIDEQMTESNALSERTAETVIKTQYGLNAEANKAGTWAFMDKINSLDTAILIESVNISDYAFGAGEEPEPGEEQKDTSQVTFVISLYSVFEMDEPVVE